MKSTIINVLVFAAGAAIGSVVTWKLLEAKYEKIVQEEIESIREVFGEEQTENDEEEDPDADNAGSSRKINWAELEDLDEEDDDDSEAESDFARVEYERLAGNYTSEEGGAEKVAQRPYVISPYDFGMLDDYHRIELTYYADGILEDAEYNIVDDVEELIGESSLFTFGEYEEDSVHVRNERLKTDFEILRDPRTYSEVRSSPNQVRDE